MLKKKKAPIITLLFKFDVHIGSVLVDMKCKENLNSNTHIEFSDLFSEQQILQIKSNVFPESYTRLTQGVHSFCFNVASPDGPIFCYSAFLSVLNPESERSFDQYSFVIATQLPFYPLFLRLLDSINFLVETCSLTPNEIFILLTEFAIKWDSHLSPITFPKTKLEINNNDISNPNSSDNTSDSSDFSINCGGTPLGTSKQANIEINFEDFQVDFSKVTFDDIEVSDSQKVESSPLNSDSSSSSSSSPIISDHNSDFNLCLSINSRFELPLFNGVVPINPHPKLAHLLSTQSYFYCANPHYIGSDLLTDVESNFEGCLSLWESCISDQPIVILASTPHKSTKAAFAISSLSYPEDSPMSLYPYISVTDPRFKTIVEKPKGIIGVSNPIVEDLVKKKAKILHVGLADKRQHSNGHFVNLPPSSLPRSKSISKSNLSKRDGISRSRSSHIGSIEASSDNMKQLDSAKIRYKLFQNTKNLRRALSEALDMLISIDILSVLLGNIDLSTLIDRMHANNLMLISPPIEFSSYLVKSKLFRHILRERLSTQSAIEKFLALNVDSIHGENAKRICTTYIHVIQEQDIGKEQEKDIKKKLRVIAPLIRSSDNAKNLRNSTDETELPILIDKTEI